MVSKVAVIALVVIVASPILLGYALNLSEVTESGYRVADDAVNVTPLLTNDVYYSDVSTNVFQYNTGANYAQWNTTGIGSNVIPIYNRISTKSTSYPLTEAKYTNQAWNGAEQSTQYKYFYEQWDYDVSQSQHSIDVYEWLNGAESLKQTITNIHSFYYNKDTHEFNYTRYTSPYLIQSGSGTGDITKLKLWSANGTCDVYVATYSGTNYADVSAGFYYKQSLGTVPVIRNELPDNTKSVLLSINLGSITDANYTMSITFNVEHFGYLFTKTTTDGNVKWTVRSIFSGGQEKELYYNPSLIDNTYQLYFSVEKTTYNNPSFEKFNTHTEIRYVGGWPSTIGQANYYQKYTYDGSATFAAGLYHGLSDISFTDFSSNVYRTPTIRYDDMVVGGYTTPVIFDNTYNPIDFRNNPATTISSINKFGDSLTFGGNTYAVSDGKITIDGKRVSVDGLVFKSIENENSTGYVNMIGNTIISETVDPSTIKFNGTWSASISTSSLESYNYTSTKWQAGSFGWDGIDHNFLIVGLITSLGAFIGVGIYARRTKTGLWPLLIVCGGAAVLFFIML